MLTDPSLSHGKPNFGRLRIFEIGLLNRLRDELRRTHRTPQIDELTGEEPAGTASQLEAVIDREETKRYDDAMSRLRESDREAIAARVEMNYSYEQVALAIGKASPDAARMAVKRALIRLAEEMDRAG